MVEFDDLMYGIVLTQLEVFKVSSKLKMARIMK